MTNCRIARVRFKSGCTLELLQRPDRNFSAHMLHDVADMAQAHDAIAAGVFFIKPNGAVYVNHRYEAGTSALHTIGGAAVLLADIQDYENKTK